MNSCGFLVFRCLTMTWMGALVLAAHGQAQAHEALETLEVVGHYEHAAGESEAASQGVIGAQLLRDRALLRPAEVLEYIPGMVVTQHSGDGKANQYFLRGMNLDHGTDFATTVNGVPINMPTHAHGQGYSDLNVLIPELVSRVDYRKGPYFASDGDFSSAGSADIVYRTRLERPMADVSIGQRGYLRSVVAASSELGEGLRLLGALERLNNNGPWTVPEGLRKTNAQLILSDGNARQGWRTSLSAYSAHWNATDQVPQRLLDAGTYQGRAFGRFDSLDPSDGGKTQRTSLSGAWHQVDELVWTRVAWYAIRYDLDLFSNFTYGLDRANDQFAQSDNRTVWGGQAHRTWLQASPQGLAMQNTLGVQWREDRIQLGLYDTVSRQRQHTVRQDGVTQLQLALYGENEVAWNAWMKTVAGLRADRLHVRVDSQLAERRTAQAGASRLSPKFSLVLGPWVKTEFFVNVGRGFHSNDARGMVAQTDPVPGLVSSRGQELGLKSRPLPEWQTTLALWQLDFDSELVYVGDAGNTEAGRPSRRTGVEWSNHWTPGAHFQMDANLAWTKPRYSDAQTASAWIVNAVQKVANLTFALKNLGPWSGALGLRYIGSAPLTETNTVRAASSLSANLRIQRKMSNDLDLALDVLNLTDRQNNDISYYYTSRLAGEPPQGVAGVHVHPAEPRTVRLSAKLRF